MILSCTHRLSYSSASARDRNRRMNPTSIGEVENVCGIAMPQGVRAAIGLLLESLRRHHRHADSADIRVNRHNRQIVSDVALLRRRPVSAKRESTEAAVGRDAPGPRGDGAGQARRKSSSRGPRPRAGALRGAASWERIALGGWRCGGRRLSAYERVDWTRATQALQLVRAAEVERET